MTAKQKLETLKITKRTLSKLRFNSDGLIPAIVQDYKTKEVLMMAYMNLDSLKATIKEGKAAYWSRSRQEFWIKGMTSGHFQYVKEIRYDCDCDTLLLTVKQVGAACHTFKKSCFYRTIEGIKTS
ncbi:MAG TPA: phosphoribosyl-AMP cyclohydrolase [Candidatus Omnitrophota bacterium]|nr:phosphoribosyl-AMP cyclohydrolase [Candidatus Omnitrophota bacterium]HSA31050.1 phosphoribosyl-AMP cyclohydrolase [Candidatus Omnitrophota bacterium]